MSSIMMATMLGVDGAAAGAGGTACAIWFIDGTSNQLYQINGGFVNTGALSATGAAQGASVSLTGQAFSNPFLGLGEGAEGHGLPSNTFNERSPHAGEGEAVHAGEQETRQHEIDRDAILEDRERFAIVLRFRDLVSSLAADRCVATLAEAARRYMAIIRANEPARAIRATSGGVEVRTDQGVYSADRLILSAGSWMRPLLHQPRARHRPRIERAHR